ncbi:MAG: hypothetical protein M0006_13000 [Magnetospirillum sp.]|nr:hypothetical protein [Magnetospirillum sp.]
MVAMVKRATPVTLLVCVCLSALPAPVAAAGPKRCLRPQDVVTEQIVRHGVFLREASARCAEITPEVTGLWRDFYATYGSRLHAQTVKRETFFQRTFKADAKDTNLYFDGRLVTNLRNVPVNRSFCQNLKKLLDANKRRGWASFVKQAKTLQDEVALDYKLCEAKR